MRKCLLLLVLALMAQVQGLEIPQQGNLHMETLDNGIKVWFQENPTPSYMVSLRSVWKTDEGMTIDALDCPYDQDEIADFFEFTKDNQGPCPKDLGIIAVGDFDKNQMKTLVRNQFSDMKVWAEAKITAPIVIKSLDGNKATNLMLAYPTALQSLKTEEALKKQWEIYFLQKLVQGKFKECFKDKWIDSVESRYLPQPACMGKVYCDGQDPLEMLVDFLIVVQDIRKTGFVDGRFKALKAEAQKSLLSMSRNSPGNNDLANYYAEQFSYGVRCPPYSFFITTSMNLISEMELRDVNLLIDQFLKDNNRLVEMNLSSTAQANEGQIMEVLGAFTADQFVLAIREDTTGSERILNHALAYIQLPLKPEESKVIGEIIEAIGNHGWLWLGMHQGELRDKEKRIKHVHPMRFLGEVFSNTHLKSCMRQVEKDSLIWSNFLKGLKPNMEKEYDRNNLFRHVEGFSQSVRADPEKVKVFIQKHDWSGLVKYLIQV